MQNIASKLFTDDDSFSTFITRIAGEYNLLHNDNICYDKFYNRFEVKPTLELRDEESFYKNLIKFYTTNADDARIKEEYDVYIKNFQSESSSKIEYLQDQISCLKNRQQILQQVDIGYKEITDKAIEVVNQYIKSLEEELEEVKSNIESPIQLENFRQYRIDTLTKKLNECIDKNDNNKKEADKAKEDIKKFMIAVDSKKNLW